jgi:hypothetical protein
MRLIDVQTYKLKEFFSVKAPPYAILSHTWGDDEVSFQDMQDLATARRRKGFHKIELCCRQALEDGFAWAWVDTCCIDKTSSAELSETINSMYAYYDQCMVCYAYLSDIDMGEIAPHVLFSSRWFTRGWTLQELIAPFNLTFYSRQWTPILCKADWRTITDGVWLTQWSHYIDIPLRVMLKQKKLTDFAIAERMRWAAGRQTTRREDMAYCLLGIFNINMPLLYGEGTKAFHRLQEELLKTNPDYSLLAWGRDIPLQPQAWVRPPWNLNTPVSSVLAESPTDFTIPNISRGSGRAPYRTLQDPPTLTSQGLRMGVYIKTVEPAIVRSDPWLSHFVQVLSQCGHSISLNDLCLDAIGRPNLYLAALPCTWSEYHTPCILMLNVRGNPYTGGELEFVRIKWFLAKEPAAAAIERSWRYVRCLLRTSNYLDDIDTRTGALNVLPRGLVEFDATRLILQRKAMTWSSGLKPEALTHFDPVSGVSKLFFRMRNRAGGAAGAIFCWYDGHNIAIYCTREPLLQATSQSYVPLAWHMENEMMPQNVGWAGVAGMKGPVAERRFQEEGSELVVTLVSVSEGDRDVFETWLDVVPTSTALIMGVPDAYVDDMGHYR